MENIATVTAADRGTAITLTTATNCLMVDLSTASTQLVLRKKQLDHKEEVMTSNKMGGSTQVFE